MITSTAVVLAARPHGKPDRSHFRVEQRELPPLGQNQVLLRTVYLSLDPYMRGRMDAGPSYAKAVQIGEVIEGGTVAEVIDSRSDLFAPGDLVLAHSGWQTHAVLDSAGLRRLDPASAPISSALGVLGMPGFAAWLGLTEIGRPQPGETLVVAAATGPVGSAVGQMARIHGARVVGIAGGPEKVAWLRELGFDAAIDHRSPDFGRALATAVPEGIDVYFENVGGAVWDAVFEHLNDFARVPVCGLVSQYNETEAPAGPNMAPALMKAINVKRLLVRGFTQRDFGAEYFDAFLQDATAWVAEGRLRAREDVIDGLENAPEAFLGMLAGRNFGKLLVRVGQDPSQSSAQ